MRHKTATQDEAQPGTGHRPSISPLDMLVSLAQMQLAGLMTGSVLLNQWTQQVTTYS
jgi:hypothetical protein